MAKADLGLKRSCLSCGMRFYDFNRTPIICPGCKTEFDPESLVRSRRGRAAAKPVEKPSNEVTAEEAVDEIVEGDNENSGEDESSDEGDVEFDDADINVENDDSAGLIGDDLDEDDEILTGINKEDEE